MPLFHDYSRSNAAIFRHLVTLQPHFAYPSGCNPKLNDEHELWLADSLALSRPSKNDDFIFAQLSGLSKSVEEHKARVGFEILKVTSVIQSRQECMHFDKISFLKA